MKLLENKTNVTAPDADYPFGSVRDKTPSVAGTIWNFEQMSDIIQFFSKMFDESGLTANGLPDNDTNGFQLFEALSTLLGGVRRKIVNIGDWDMDTDGAINVAHGIADYSKIRSVKVMIIPDASTALFPLDQWTGSDVSGGVISIDSTIINLGREAAGFFDTTDFDSTSFNRGYVLIDYTI